MSKQANEDAMKKVNLFKQKCNENPELGKTKKNLKTILITCFTLYALLMLINIIFNGLVVNTLLISTLSLIVFFVFCIGIMNGIKTLALLPLIGCLRSLYSIIISIITLDFVNNNYKIYFSLYGIINIILIALFSYILLSPRIKKYETEFKSINLAENV